MNPINLIGPYIVLQQQQQQRQQQEQQLLIDKRIQLNIQQSFGTIGRP